MKTHVAGTHHVAVYLSLNIDKSSVSQHHEEVPSHKLEQFLQKQRDFVEKRKKSI